MPSLRMKTHIVLICITTVYLPTVEGLDTIIKDASNSDFDKETDAVILQLLRKLQYKQKQNEIKTLSKISDNKRLGKRDLRDKPVDSGHDFLIKLNNFIKENTHNYYYEKRDNCHFGFGPPGSNCKKDKFRRHYSTGNSISRGRKEKKDKLNYAQHMLIERARYISSSESNSDDDSPSRPQKSRFQIINNAKTKYNRKIKQEESSDQDYYDDKTLQMGNTDDSDDSSNEAEQVISDHNAESDKRKESSDSDSSAEIDVDEKYLYLQGSRLQNPNFRSRSKVRRSLREPHFMPKRYKWDDNMLTHLDDNWKTGIQSYDTHRQKYARYWPYKYYK